MACVRRTGAGRGRCDVNPSSFSDNDVNNDECLISPLFSVFDGADFSPLRPGIFDAVLWQNFMQIHKIAKKNLYFKSLAEMLLHLCAFNIGPRESMTCWLPETDDQRPTSFCAITFQLLVHPGRRKSTWILSWQQFASTHHETWLVV